MNRYQERGKNRAFRCLLVGRKVFLLMNHRCLPDKKNRNICNIVNFNCLSSKKHKKALLIIGLFFFKTLPFHVYLTDTVNTKTFIPVGVDGSYCAHAGKMLTAGSPSSKCAFIFFLFRLTFYRLVNTQKFA